MVGNYLNSKWPSKVRVVVVVVGERKVSHRKTRAKI